ncbi:hypothetical protein ACIBCO_31930 [Streptomyces violascens]
MNNISADTEFDLDLDLDLEVALEDRPALEAKTNTGTCLACPLTYYHC